MFTGHSDICSLNAYCEMLFLLSWWLNLLTRFCWKEATELAKCTVFEKHMALLIIPMFIATIVASLIDLSFGPGMICLLGLG